MTKDEELKQLRQENSALREQVALLSERISALEAQLAKDSHNSHLPPSSDRFHRQPKSLRKKSGKQPGGEAGRAGNTLKVSETPDLVIDLPPKRVLVLPYERACEVVEDLLSPSMSVRTLQGLVERCGRQAGQRCLGRHRHSRGF